jgi:hypothetical protein
MSIIVEIIGSSGTRYLIVGGKLACILADDNKIVIDKKLTDAVKRYCDIEPNNKNLDTLRAYWASQIPQTTDEKEIINNSEYIVLVPFAGRAKRDPVACNHVVGHIPSRHPGIKNLRVSHLPRVVMTRREQCDEHGHHEKMILSDAELLLDCEFVGYKFCSDCGAKL